VFVSRFSTSGFDPGDFRRHGIECPPRIAQSVPKRQVEYLHGRLAAIAALEELGHRTRSIPSGAHREPLWPAGTVGSITHAAGLAAAVALPADRGLRIGIDLEHLAAGGALAALAGTVLSTDELQRLPGDASAPAMTAVFSAKESFYKAAFAEVGRFFDFDALEFRGVDSASGTLAFVIRQDLSPRLQAGRPVDIHHTWLEPTTVLTVCVLPART